MNIKKVLQNTLVLSFTAVLFSCASETTYSETVENIQEQQSDISAANAELNDIEEPLVYDNTSASVLNNTDTPDNLEKVEDEEGFFMSDRTVLDDITIFPAPSDINSFFNKYNNDTAVTINEGDNTAETPDDSNETDFSPSITIKPVTESNFTIENGSGAADETHFGSGTDVIVSSSDIDNSNKELSDSGELTETSEDSEYDEEETAADETETIPEIIKPSRSVTLKKNQYLDIEYPGTGWIYLGEKDDTSFFRYFGRKRNAGNTSFSLRSREEGTAVLHFYKNDALTNEYIDDYLEVIISGTDTNDTHVKAPSYANFVPAKPKNRVSINKDDNTDVIEESSTIDINPYGTYETSGKNRSDASVKKTEQKKNTSSAASASSASRKTTTDNDAATVIQKTESAEAAAVKNTSKNQQSSKNEETSENSNAKETDALKSEEILKLAQDCYKKGEYEKTLAYLDDFFKKATEKIDEGLFLQGQTYESNSSVRNIKNALDTYESLIRDYPQSVNWSKAYERVTYLKRFYFSIR